MSNTARRAMLAERDDGRCAACGAIDRAWDADHVIPIAEGGVDELVNLQTLCKPCHRVKTRREAILRRTRSLVPQQWTGADVWSRQPTVARNRLIASLVADSELSLQEIGARFGLGKERVRQIAHMIWARDNPRVT